MDSHPHEETLEDAVKPAPNARPLPNVMNGMKYPGNRPSFFAHWYIRKLGQTCAANEIDQSGCWLLTQVVLVEDIRRYKSPPTFYNMQLAAIIGTSCENTLIRTRKKVISAGLLHYEPGSRGRAGTYWVEVPLYWDGIPNKPLGEETDSPPNLQGMCQGNVRESGGATCGNVEALLTSSFSNSTTTVAAVADEDFQSAEKRMLGLGLAKARETIQESLSNGTTLQTISSVIDFYCSRPGAWGPGALRRRLTLGNAQALASAQGWPPASSRENEVRRSETVARDRLKQQAEAQSAADRKAKEVQLELQFGPILDALPPDEVTRLVTQRKPYLLKSIQQYGMGSKMIRSTLLGLLAEAAEPSR